MHTPRIRASFVFAACTALTACGAEADLSSAANIAEIRGNGRSGHFATRALLSADRSVTVDTTTGFFDRNDPPPPGLITSLLMRVYNANGGIVFVQHFNQIDLASYTFAMESLPRGTAYQIQAHVQGIRFQRESVVTTSGIVALRPDIIVGPNRDIVGPNHGGIVGPNRVRVGVPVLVTGLLSEINGDVGAKTDCVMTVDSVEVGRQPALDVPANGSIGCAFSYTFSAVGTHTVTLSATNVLPGDYNTANNSLSSVVGIVGPNR